MTRSMSRRMKSSGTDLDNRCRTSLNRLISLTIRLTCPQQGPILGPNIEPDGPMYSQISEAMICWSQRTKAEMTMASMHVPTLHEARAKGIYARVSNHNLRMDRTVCAAGRARVRGRLTIPGKPPQDDGGRKNGFGCARWYHALALSLSKSSRPNFCFPPEILLRPKMFEPTHNAARC
jgi:hypothetical protein